MMAQKITSLGYTLEEEDPLTPLYVKIGEVLNQRNKEWENCSHISRQITWESKRCVSQVVGYFQNRNAMKNSGINLQNIVMNEKFFKGLAKLLFNLDDFQFVRSYNAAIEEFIEAFALRTYFKEGRLITYEEVKNRLTYELEVPQDDDKQESQIVSYSIPFSKTDFYSGLCDIPGELVRACTSGFHSANFKYFLFSSCSLVRALYQCLQTLHPAPRGFPNKLFTMKSSLMKLEAACYHSTIESQKFQDLLALGIFMQVTGLRIEEDEEITYED